MTVTKEVRIVMPFTTEQFQKGQLYSVPRSSKEASSSTDGIELVKKESFVHETSGKEGTYTEKIYHLDSYVPGYLKAILPASALRLDEKAWDCYPHCKTVITNPFLGEEKFSFVIETMHKELDPFVTIDKKEETEQKEEKKGSWWKKAPKSNKEKTRNSELPFEENALNLPQNVLENREIYYMDISTDRIADKKGMKEGEEPDQFEGKNSGLGPLQKDWQFENWKKKMNGEESFPMMCAYKLVTIKCKVLGIGSKVESYLWNTEIEIFLKFFKQVFCWSDIWWNLSREEIAEHDKKMFDETSNILGVDQKKESQKKDDKEIAEKLSKLQFDEQVDGSSSVDDLIQTTE